MLLLFHVGINSIMVFMVIMLRNINNKSNSMLILLFEWRIIYYYIISTSAIFVVYYLFQYRRIRYYHIYYWKWDITLYQCSVRSKFTKKNVNNDILRFSPHFSLCILSSYVIGFYTNFGFDTAIVVEMEFKPRNVIVRWAAKLWKFVRPNVRIRPIVVQREPVVPVKYQVWWLLIVAE